MTRRGETERRSGRDRARSGEIGRGGTHLEEAEPPEAEPEQDGHKKAPPEAGHSLANANAKATTAAVAAAVAAVAAAAAAAAAGRADGALVLAERPDLGGGEDEQKGAEQVEAAVQVVLPRGAQGRGAAAALGGAMWGACGTS